MTLFWPSHSDEPENVRNNFVQVYELDQDEVSQDLGLDPLLLIPKGVHCPRNFSWKGLIFLYITVKNILSSLRLLIIKYRNKTIQDKCVY